MIRSFSFACAICLALALALVCPVSADPGDPAAAVPAGDAVKVDSRLFEALRMAASAEARAFVRADSDAVRAAESRKLAEEARRQKEAEEQAQKDALKKEAEAKKRRLRSFPATTTGRTSGSRSAP